MAPASPTVSQVNQAQELNSQYNQWGLGGLLSKSLKHALML